MNIEKRNQNEITNNSVFYVTKRGSLVHKHKIFVGCYLSYGSSSSSSFEVFKVVDFENKELKDGNYYVSIKCECVISAYSHEIGKISDKTLSTIEEYYTIISDLDLSEIRKQADAIFSGDLDINEMFKESEYDGSTDLVTIKSKEYYDNMLQIQHDIKSKIGVIRGVISNKVNEINNNLKNQIYKFNKVISDLEEIIFTIELYGGVKEDLKQINSGVPASLDSKIHIIQQMSFMDEECGDPENGGISYDSLDKFYDWLLKYNSKLGYKHYELILPYEKCICSMRVRREISEQSRYDRDNFGNYYGIHEEMKTCLLIRNGENIYVIHSKMDFLTKLFPDVDESQSMFDIDMALKYYCENNPNDYKVKKLEEYREHLVDKIRTENEKLYKKYRNGMILIQGIFDRTDILAQQGTIGLLSNKSVQDGSVILNYSHKLIDGEKSNLDRFLTYTFKPEDQIPIGTRILYTGYVSSNYSRSTDRFTKFYQNDFNLPPEPSFGVYTIEEFVDNPESTTRTFRYLPDTMVYTTDNKYVKRTKKERFKVYPYDDIYDFDKFSHRDLEFLENVLYDRKYRKRYLSLVPMIEQMKKFKNEELKKERDFVLMVNALFPELTENTIRDYVYHWKTKNKWKRALESDDQKAFRMITKKIKRDIKENNIFKLTENFKDDKEDC